MSRAEITTPEVLSDESVVELSLRPQRLAEFIGQQKVKDNLRLAIDAALARSEPLDHAIFYGPPGLGKTTLAELIARELRVNIRTTSGPALEKPGDLVGTLTNLRAGDILFIDEIHRLRPVIEECMARCVPWLAGKPVRLTLDAAQDEQLLTNDVLAQSVIWNLLRNACQYTEEGEVRVELRGTTLRVADTGPGLPSSIDAQQFQRFVTSARQSGEGLGLSIVQRVVEHLGWQMTVETSVRGCCFTLQMRPAAADT